MRPPLSCCRDRDRDHHHHHHHLISSNPNSIFIMLLRKVAMRPATFLITIILILVLLLANYGGNLFGSTGAAASLAEQEQGSHVANGDRWNHLAAIVGSRELTSRVAEYNLVHDEDDDGISNNYDKSSSTGDTVESMGQQQQQRLADKRHRFLWRATKYHRVVSTPNPIQNEDHNKR